MAQWTITKFCIIGEQPYFTVMFNDKPMATFFSEERAKMYISLNS